MIKIEMKLPLKTRKERNKEATRRYREGQKNTITNLENQNIRLIKENDALNMEIISLKREVDYWKQQAMNQASQNIQQQTIYSYPNVPIQPPVLNLPNYQNHLFFNQNTNVTTRANFSTSMTSMLSQISRNKNNK